MTQRKGIYKKNYFFRIPTCQRETDKPLVSIFYRKEFYVATVYTLLFTPPLTVYDKLLLCKNCQELKNIFPLTNSNLLNAKSFFPYS